MSDLYAGAVTLQAMSLEVPHTPGHPNKHPFSGVLTKIDEPSDRPPSGGNERRVVLTRKAAEDALPTLLGMSVDFTDDLGGHDVTKKIGVITRAEVQGNEIQIGGFFYAADFPAEVGRIKAMRSVLGFSWEIANIYTNDVNADPMLITGCVFTGAAVLRKDKAAYQTTSLAASATKEITMTKEEMQAMLDASMKAMGETIDTKLAPVVERIEKVEKASEGLQASAHHVSLVEPHADALEKVGMAMEKDGIGGHPMRGHVKACYAMASHLRAAASKGELASEWPGYAGFHDGTGNVVHASGKTDEEKAADAARDAELKKLTDTIAGLNTKIADLQAAASKTGTAPERKTLTPQITALLAKAGIGSPKDGETLTVGALDNAFKAANLPTQSRMEVKAALEKAGLLAAA